MKNFSLLLCLIVGIIFSKNANSQTSKDYAVLATATVQKSPPQITIKWPPISAGITKYAIYKKSQYSNTWGTNYIDLKATDTMWTDTAVKIGEKYEYKILKINGQSLLGMSYLLSGIEVPVVHSRGNILVLVENELMDSLPLEISTYLKELANDGWKVYSTTVKASDSIQKVKREVMSFHAISGGLRALFILGHVPVPYSGNFGNDSYYTVPPDGHTPDHNGAWPTDAYYSIDSDDWTDNLTNTNGISRAANKNLPGDFKWDNIDLPGEVLFYTGRVDLSDLPKFKTTEIQLIKRYLQKAHDFRFGNTKTVEKAVIDENFSASIGAFASTGWRNFTAMFGSENIIEKDFLTTCRTANLLFSYGTGGGSYSNCNGIGNTDSFVNSKAAVFNMLFGSYFGDWNSTNNILRAPLAHHENGLTNAWSGRPWWQNHPMALGEPIGYCAMITQNNKGRGQGLYSDNVFGNTIPIGLMGDPTLRLHVVMPPSNVKATALDNETKVNISWTASSDPEVIGYYVYRSGNPLSNNFPIQNNPITTNSYVDQTPYNGTNHYVVKAVKLTKSSSGTYFNLSQGISDSIMGIKGTVASFKNVESKNIAVYPNPTNGDIRVKGIQNLEGIEIIDIHGKTVKKLKIELESSLLSQPIHLNDLSQGLYFLKSNSSVIKFFKY